MTFEEFKREQEKFTKVDTPEKMLILQERYDKYLFLLEDNKHFEPVIEWNDEKDLVSIYEKHIHAILNFNPMEEDRLYFLVKPSFEAEHLLIIEKADSAYTLKHCTVKTSFWIEFYENPALATAETIISEGILNKPLGDQIFKVVDAAMKAARKPSGKWFTIDGVEYRISKIVGNQRMDVKKNPSWEEDTPPGRIIRLLETVIKLTQPNPGIDIERDLVLKLELITAGE